MSRPIEPVKSDTRQPFSAHLAAAVVLLVWAGVMIAASQVESERLWGLNFLAFTPAGVFPWFLAIVAVALLVTLYPRPIRLTLSRRSSARSGMWWPYNLLLLFAVVAACFMLDARIAILGDGIMRASDAMQIATPLPSELLPSALSMLLARRLPESWGIGGYNALRLISLASGVMLTLGLCWLAPKAEIKRPYWFIGWILTFGSARLFAGYVESYAPAAAFAILWTVALLAYRKGNANALTVILLWLCAFLSHATMMVLAPATLFVLAWGRDATRPRWAPALTFAVLAAAVGTYVGVRMSQLQIGQAGALTGSFLMPLMARAPHNYGILSPAHLGDWFNQMVLLAPAFIVGFIAVMISGSSVQTTPADAGLGSDDRKQNILFWVLATGVPALASLLIDPKLGWPRDWDLFTLFFAPAMAGAALWLAGLRASPARRAAVSVALVSCGLWMVFSVNPDAELRRYNALLDLDPSRGDYGHEILALYYRQIDNPTGEVDEYKKALAVTDNIRYRANIAAACIKAGQYFDAVDWYQSILDRDSTYTTAVFGMAIALQYVGRIADALPYAETACKLMPQDPERQFTLGTIQSHLHEFEAALPHLEAAAIARPDNIDYLNPLAGCYLRLDHYERARTVWQHVLKLNPNFAPAYLNSSMLELSAQNLPESRRLLGEYERRVPTDEQRPEARWLADTLARAGN